MIRLLVWLGFRRWEAIDWDGPFVLLRCRWTGETQTAVPGRCIRRLYPGMKARWQT